MKEKLKALILPITLFLITVIGMRFYYLQKSPVIGRTNLYAHLGGDFKLNSATGEKSLKDFHGRPSVLYFGFTSCPDVCPLSLTKLNKVLDKIDPKSHSQINKVFISVDYKRDTPEIVQEYTQHFSQDFIGLTGTKEQIEDMTKKYAVHFEFVELKDSALKYTVDHTSRFFLLNKDGAIVNTYSDIVNDPKFRQDIKGLLQ